MPLYGESHNSRVEGASANPVVLTKLAFRILCDGHVVLVSGPRNQGYEIPEREIRSPDEIAIALRRFGQWFGMPITSADVEYVRELELPHPKMFLKFFIFDVPIPVSRKESIPTMTPNGRKLTHVPFKELGRRVEVKNLRLVYDLINRA